MTTPIRLALTLTILCPLLYIAAACNKTTNITQPINVTLIRDTTILVDSPLDKQIMLYMPTPMGDLNTTPNFAQYKIYHFNKANYAGVDSAIFMANPNVYGDTSYYSQVYLYDFTDSVAIAGSMLTNNTTSQNVYLQTGNIFNALPNKEITLGVAIQASKNEQDPDNNIVQVTAGYLFLYRK